MVTKKSGVSASGKARKPYAGRVRKGRSKNEKDAAVKLGEAIRAARVARGMQQQALAALIGWDKARLSRVENGTRRINATDYQRLMDALEVNSHQLNQLQSSEGSTAAGLPRYVPVPVIARHRCAKSGKAGAITIATEGAQSILLDWLEPRLDAKALRIMHPERSDAALGGAELVVVDTSDTEVKRQGVYLLWSFGAVSLNQCEPDLSSGKIKVRGSDDAAALKDAASLEVLGRAVMVMQRL